MSISINLGPDLEARLEQEVRQLGVSPAEYIKTVLERVLTPAPPSPASLLQAVRSNTPMGDPDASEHVSAKVKAKLYANRTD